MDLPLNCVQRRASVLAVWKTLVSTTGDLVILSKFNPVQMILHISSKPVIMLISFVNVFIDDPLFLRRFNQKALCSSFFFLVSYTNLPSQSSLTYRTILRDNYKLSNSAPYIYY
jgi:hypothetical protein